MRNLRKIWLLLMPTLFGCAASSTVPVAVSCPPPRPIPVALSSPVSTAPPLNQRIESSLQKYEQALTKAQRTP